MKDTRLKDAVNIVDVAARAGVAKSTVSNVLTGKKFVSDELREKVLRACEELDYHPNFYASTLSSKKSNILALLLESSDDINKKIYKNLIVSCVKEASMHGYSLLIYYNSDRETLLDTLRRGCAPIDGAIMMSPCLHDERISQIDSQHINFVVLGRPENAEKINYVDVDNTTLTKNTALKLIELTGLKNIYLINSEGEMTISQDRYRGFYEACMENGINMNDRVISRRIFVDPNNESYIRSIVDKDSVFITCDDIVAQQIYRISAEKGLKIGYDVSVFSLGRALDNGTFDPPLSYARQDYTLLGKTAVEMLVDQLNDVKTPQCALVESEIVVGYSVKNNKWQTAE